MFMKVHTHQSSSFEHWLGAISILWVNKQHSNQHLSTLKNCHWNCHSSQQRKNQRKSFPTEYISHSRFPAYKIIIMYKRKSMITVNWSRYPWTVTNGASYTCCNGTRAEQQRLQHRQQCCNEMKEVLKDMRFPFHSWADAHWQVWSVLELGCILMVTHYTTQNQKESSLSGVRNPSVSTLTWQKCQCLKFKEHFLTLTINIYL